MWPADHKSALLGFAVSAAYWPGMLSAAFTPRWAVIAVGLPLLTRMDPRDVPEPLRWVLAALLAVGAVSLAGSPDPKGGALDLIFMVLLCGTFVAGAGLTSLDGVMTGAAAGLAISAILCTFQTVPSGLFYSSEVMAEFAALVFVWGALRPNLPAVMIAAIPIALSGSRIAIVMAAVALLLAARQSPRVTASGLVVLATAAVASLMIFKPESAADRIDLWAATVAALMPLGHGLGWFGATYPSDFSHSDVAQALAELGAAAALLAAIPIFVITRDRGNDAERAVFWAACFEAVVSFPLHMPATGFVAAIAAGHLVSRRSLVLVGDRLGGLADGSRGGRALAADRAVDRRSYGGTKQISPRPVPASANASCGVGQRAG